MSSRSYTMRFAVIAACLWLLTLPLLLVATNRWGAPWPGVAHGLVVSAAAIAITAERYRGRHRATGPRRS